MNKFKSKKNIQKKEKKLQHPSKKNLLEQDLDPSHYQGNDMDSFPFDREKLKKDKKNIKGYHFFEEQEQDQFNPHHPSKRKQSDFKERNKEKRTLNSSSLSKSPQSNYEQPIAHSKAHLRRDEKNKAMPSSPYFNVSKMVPKLESKPITSPKYASPSSSKESSISKQSIRKLERPRRKRQEWTDAEVDHLRIGVEQFGMGSWSEILSYYKFSPNRTAVDLKDKWRNLENYRPYRFQKIRKFVLLDENHNYLLNQSGNVHCFKNRWPRDAALKVASRDDFYPHPESTGPITIFLREVFSKNTNDDIFEPESDLKVHVYTGYRQRVLTPAIAKFEGQRMMWMPNVIKLRTEALSYGKKALVSNYPSISSS